MAILSTFFAKPAMWLNAVSVLASVAAIIYGVVKFSRWDGRVILHNYSAPLLEGLVGLLISAAIQGLPLGLYHPVAEAIVWVTYAVVLLVLAVLGIVAFALNSEGTVGVWCLVWAVPAIAILFYAWERPRTSARYSVFLAGHPMNRFSRIADGGEAGGSPNSSAKSVKSKILPARPRVSRVVVAWGALSTLLALFSIVIAFMLVIESWRLYSAQHDAESDPLLTGYATVYTVDGGGNITSDNASTRDDDSTTTLDLGRSGALYFNCSGEAASSLAPTILLEGARGLPSSTIAPLRDALVAQGRRVCLYDRPGYGYSPQGLVPTDPVAVVEVFTQLLEIQGEVSPFDVVAHNDGLDYARLFYATHPTWVNNILPINTASAGTELPSVARARWRYFTAPLGSQRFTPLAFNSHPNAFFMRDMNLFQAQYFELNQQRNTTVSDNNLDNMMLDAVVVDYTVWENPDALAAKVVDALNR